MATLQLEMFSVWHSLISMKQHMDVNCVSSAPRSTTVSTPTLYLSNTGTNNVNWTDNVSLSHFIVQLASVMIC